MWVVKLEHYCGENVVSRREVMTITRPQRLESLEDLGLTLDDAKTLLTDIQQLIVAEQFERAQEADTMCAVCGRRRWVKDYTDRRFYTLFGRVTVRQARLRCPLWSANTMSDTECRTREPRLRSAGMMLVIMNSVRTAGSLLVDLTALLWLLGLLVTNVPFVAVADDDAL